MQAPDSVDEIQYMGQTVMVAKHKLPSRNVYHVTFSDGRPPLVMAVAERGDGQRFWTSIPEGRQTEAEQVGRQYAIYVKSKK